MVSFVAVKGGRLMETRAGAKKIENYENGSDEKKISEVSARLLYKRDSKNNHEKRTIPEKLQIGPEKKCSGVPREA